MLRHSRFNSTHFIFFFTLLNLVQIVFTELTSDEGYYWFYSLKLDWGYYDHPPLTGGLTYLGRLISNSTFGIRLFHTILISIGIWFMFKLIPPKEKAFAGIIILAIPLFNYISFLLFPDTALIGISAILLFAYHQFLTKNNLHSALFFGSLLGISLLSKYHAILLPFFIVLSNLRLLRNKYFYLAIFLAFLIFLPHLIWEFNHNFISFKYHLIGRNDPFKSKYFFEYLTTQIGVIGIGIMFIPFVFKPTNQFEKSLKFITIGTFIFFALCSVKGYVHMHWTSIALVPIILISSKFYYARKRNYLFNFSVVPFVGIILFIRIYLMTNFLSVNRLNVDYYHGRTLWAEDIAKVANGRSVAFNIGNRGLRVAPMYAFYSGNFSVALFPGERKKSEYQILNYEDSIQSTDVMLINNDKQGLLLKTRMGKSERYKLIENFTSFSNIQVTSDYKKVTSFETPIKIAVSIYNHRQDELKFSEKHKIFIEFEGTDGKKFKQYYPLNTIGNIPSNSKKTLLLELPPYFLPPSEYSFIIGFSGHDISDSVNSKRSKILITN